MTKELCNKVIYNDFIEKTILSNDEKIILDMYLKRYSIVKISQECCMSERNVSRIIREIKNKYDKYKNMELAKYEIFLA